MKEYIDKSMIYTDLMKLTEDSEAFYFVDQLLDNTIYRIFLYRLASYTDFCQKSALESSGIMFKIDDNDNAIKLVCVPPHKFFNLHENPFTMDIDHRSVTNAFVKEDGSLISTFMHNDELRLKTKGSLSSSQAIDAMTWLDKPENSEMKGLLTYLTNKGITVNLEWTSPNNRIVLEYSKSALIILNMRYNNNGIYISYMNQFMVKDDLNFYKDKSLDELRAAKCIEGWVCRTKDGQLFKLKTDWYVHLHHTKNSINSSKHLFHNVINETSDDLKQLFVTDTDAISRILIMEDIVEKEYNHNCTLIDNYIIENKLLNKKDYAIKGKKELPKMLFSVAMSKYNNGKLSVKDIMIKNYRVYTDMYEAKLDEKYE